MIFVVFWKFKRSSFFSKSNQIKYFLAHFPSAIIILYLAHAWSFAENWKFSSLLHWELSILFSIFLLFKLWLWPFKDATLPITHARTHTHAHTHTPTHTHTHTHTHIHTHTPTHTHTHTRVQTMALAQVNPRGRDLTLHQHNKRMTPTVINHPPKNTE